MLNKRDLVKIFGVVVLAELFLRWPVQEETADKIRAKAQKFCEKIENSGQPGLSPGQTYLAFFSLHEV